MPEATLITPESAPDSAVHTPAGAMPDPAAETWALVEIFGHRQHYGRVTEVERFGTKMMRVDVPLAEPDQFETFFYGGGSIFSITPMTEEAARKWAEKSRPRPFRPLDRLPAPDPFDDVEEIDEHA